MPRHKIQSASDRAGQKDPGETGEGSSIETAMVKMTLIFKNDMLNLILAEKYAPKKPAII